MGKRIVEGMLARGGEGESGRWEKVRSKWGSCERTWLQGGVVLARGGVADAEDEGSKEAVGVLICSEQL